ncbi:NTP pyrophosphatase, house-cleaning of non-canonical NTPs [Bhargavaea ginsengi]|uniref:NTP pyrophosphatase, house-cleaning of non-canonical NTPs n=1 Tax=Bhargavaea ginsengi TaxID=426757 RepID=A0A1H7BLP0_9BACL|nr:nucleotide pyrophosphohydrolase [Bhargavaea ginsengi]SEJ75482.1 NTP pyrophosphatase, house-cleaning of non-canonical NTPs [Bhargavaea ginsengi]
MKTLTEEILDFNKARGWTDGNRDARNLAISVALEASELLEHFQWLPGKQAVEQNRDGIMEEAADVYIYLLQLADVAGFDLDGAAREKLQKNALKYPVPAGGHE